MTHESASTEIFVNSEATEQIQQVLVISKMTTLQNCVFFFWNTFHFIKKRKINTKERRKNTSDTSFTTSTFKHQTEVNV
jgi:hypothetical protein